jgi:hypothetical protein
MTAQLERLRAAGIATEPAPGVEAVLAELSEAEVDALISIKRRFDERWEVEGHGMSAMSPAAFFDVL